jgi:hypothetical protein
MKQSDAMVLLQLIREHADVETVGLSDREHLTVWFRDGSLFEMDIKGEQR